MACGETQVGRAVFLAPTGGTLRALSAQLDGAMGAGDSEIFTVRNVTGGVDVGLSCAVGPGAQSCDALTCTSNCGVNAGDQLVIRFNRSPTTPNESHARQLVLEVGGTSTWYVAGKPFNVNTQYGTVTFAMGSTATAAAHRLPQAVRLQNLYAYCNVNPSVASTVTLRAGSDITTLADTALRCTIGTAGGATCADLADVVDVPAGTYLQLSITSQGSTTNTKWCSFAVAMGDPPGAPPTNSPTSTLTAVPTATATTVPTGTATALPTPSATGTPTSAPALTATPTPVASATLTLQPTATPTNTGTATAVPTETPTRTSTSTPSLTAIAVPTTTATMTPSGTPLNTDTPTPVATATPTSMPSLTATGVPTVTATMTPTGTPLNTDTPTPVATATPTSAPSFTATAVPTTVATMTPSGTPLNTDTPTPVATATPTGTPSFTSTGVPTATATKTPTNTPSVSATAVPTATATSSATVTASATPTPPPVVTATPTVTATATPTVASVTMQQPLLFYRLSTSASGVRYGHTGGNTAESPTQGRMPTAGRLQNLSLWCNAAPGGTGSYTVTLRRNGADTALSCVVSGAAQSCQSLAAVDYNAGDLLDLAGTPSGAPSTAPTCSASLQLSGNGGSPATHSSVVAMGYELPWGPSDGSFCGQASNGTWPMACGETQVGRAGFWAPTGGTLQAMAVHLDGVMGAGNSEIFTVRNVTSGLDVGLTCAVGPGAQSCDALTCTSNCGVNAGEQVVVRFNRSAASPNEAHARQIVLEIGGTSTWYTTGKPFNVNTQYGTIYNNFATTPSAEAQRLPQAVRLQNLYAGCSVNPSAALTVTVRTGSDVTTLADTALRCTIGTTGAKTCMDLADAVDVPAGAYVQFSTTSQGVTDNSKWCSFAVAMGDPPAP
jgi:hypothetical protein